MKKFAAVDRRIFYKITDYLHIDTPISPKCLFNSAIFSPASFVPVVRTMLEAQATLEPASNVSINAEAQPSFSSLQIENLAVSGGSSLVPSSLTNQRPASLPDESSQTTNFGPPQNINFYSSSPELSGKSRKEYLLRERCPGCRNALKSCICPCLTCRRYISRCKCEY